MQVSPDFGEKVLILLLTVALSGLLAPYVLKRFEEYKTREQKNREAQLSRQAKLIDAQAEFLDTISRLLWDWRYAYMRVAYYGGVQDTQRYEAAWQRYSETVWETLSQIRYQISRSRRLVSEEAYNHLLAFYQKIVDSDKSLLEATKIENPVARSLELGDLNYLIFREITEGIDALLHDLAAEVQLSNKLQARPSD
jgi:hypothetical protein